MHNNPIFTDPRPILWKDQESKNHNWQFRSWRDTSKRRHVKAGKQVDKNGRRHWKTECNGGHAGFKLLVLPSGQPADLFVWFIVLFLLWGIVFVFAHSPLTAYLSCLWLKLQLQSTEPLKLVWHICLTPLLIHPLKHDSKIPLPPQRQDTRNPTMKSKRQTNNTNCVDVFSR